MQTFNLSANIENGFAKGMQYIVTPNAQNVVNNLINGFRLVSILIRLLVPMVLVSLAFCLH